jgi:hypothetical protein
MPNTSVTVSRPVAARSPSRELIENLPSYSSIVVVIVKNALSEHHIHVGHTTGVVVAADASGVIVVTNSHAVRDSDGKKDSANELASQRLVANNIRVIPTRDTSNGEQVLASLPATLVCEDTQDDICALHIAPSQWMPKAVVFAQVFPASGRIFTYGFPGELWTRDPWLYGVAGNVAQAGDTCWSDVAYVDGQSGSPVFQGGRVVGLVVGAAKPPFTRNLRGAIVPVDRVRSLLESSADRQLAEYPGLLKFKKGKSHETTNNSPVDRLPRFRIGKPASAR